MKQLLLLPAAFLLLQHRVVLKKSRFLLLLPRHLTVSIPAATDVKWGKESAKEYEAEFRLNGNNVSANFGSDGAWVETETVDESNRSSGRSSCCD